MSTVKADNNVGDVALGYQPNTRREDMLNKAALKMNIFPGEVVNKSRPNGNYQFAWVPYSDADYFQDLKDEGYKPVIQSEWQCERWDWFTPTKDQWRWSVSDMLTHRDSFLMYRDETLWRAQQEAQHSRVENQIRDQYEGGINAGQSLGLAVEGEYAGKQVRVEAPKKRVTVS